MAESPSCALCRRRGDADVPVATHFFCKACLAAIGRFVCEGPAPIVESLWGAPPAVLARRALSDIVEDEIEKIRRLARADDPSLEPAIADFKTSLAPGPRPGVARAEETDAISHLDLAIAYRETGLTDEAFGEAALALRSADRLGDRAHEAGAMVLNPGRLRSSLEQTLDSLRTVLFPA